MDANLKVKKTMPSDREADMLLDSEIIAALQDENIDKIPKVPYTKAMIMLVVIAAKKVYSNSHYRKGGSTMKILAFLRQLALMYYVNGEYYERRAIELNDPSMILDLGYRYYDVRIAYSKPPIDVRNTNVIGDLLVIVKKVDNTRYYLIESILASTNEKVKSDIIGKATGEVIHGYISGELYLIRSQSVSMDGEAGKWTPYFVIRAN